MFFIPNKNKLIKLFAFLYFSWICLELHYRLIDALAYECYVCENQENNNEKCIKTVKTCSLDDNSCMTIVRWGSKCLIISFLIFFQIIFLISIQGTPYWDPTGQKQFYISKQCSNTVRLTRLFRFCIELNIFLISAF